MTPEEFEAYYKAPYPSFEELAEWVKQKIALPGLEPPAAITIVRLALAVGRLERRVAELEAGR